MKKIKYLMMALWLLGMNNIALAEEMPLAADDTQAVIINDPYESFNRVVFNINDFIDRAALKPIATVYKTIVPKPISKAIVNFFANFYTIPTVINDVLQGNLYQATNDAWRFTINTTIGLLGFVDAATYMGLEPNTEDFGLTLARWGYKNSNYLVLPIFGASTVRDGIFGLPVYYFMTPYAYITPMDVNYSIYAVDLTSRRAEILNYQSVFDQVMLDKYSFVRNAYLQRRAYQIQRNTELGNPYLEKNGASIEKKQVKLEQDIQHDEIPPLALKGWMHQYA
jgi:phospholipid-binding lipoprotein MlaA